jgi:hypothetical protein
MLTLLVMLNTGLQAGVTGKVAGQIIDKRTGEPLPGANVLLEGTIQGAATDINGEYYIINIQPGTYKIRVEMIGYRTLVFEDINISVDHTTILNADLLPQVVESDQIIVVTAERSQIQKDLTSSEMTISAKTIEALPVRSVADMVSLQAGVVRDASGELHIRGGRTTEISYMVDGVQVIDPTNRRSGINIDDQAIEELKTITGTFNAEYGQALSGVINIVTKRGSDQFKINVIGYLGDYLSYDDDTYYVMNNSEWANAAARGLSHGGNYVIYDFSGYGGSTTETYKEKPYLTRQSYLDSYNPVKNQDLQVNISGPLPFTGKKVTYFASARYNYAPGYAYGKRYFMPWGYQAPASDTEHSFKMADNKLVPLNWYRGISTQSKIFVDLGKSVNLSYGLYYNNDRSYGVAGWGYKYVPDAGTNHFNVSQTHILSVQHILSPSTFYDIKASYYDKDYKGYLYKDPYDYRYMPTNTSDFEQYVFGRNTQDDISLVTRSNDFYYYGNPVDFSYSKVKYLTLNFDFTSQMTKRHLGKMGFSARLHELENEWFQLQFSTENYRPVIPSEKSPYHVLYNHKPKEIAAYIQDKIEFQELIINLGLRFDYFDPNGKILADPMDPEVYDPVKMDHIYKNYDPDLPDSLLVEYTTAERLAFWYKKASPSYQLSPRFGLSFPITDQGIIHFSYGHFFQNPEFQYLYANPNFWIEGAGSTSLVGNANLKSERTIMYELGLQQEVMSGLYLHVTGFYRDIRDWISTGNPIDTYHGVTYYQYVNKDHAEAKGVTVSGSYRRDKFTMNVDYTYMTAKGTSSNPQDAYFDALGDKEPRRELIDLAWDQPHSLSTVLSYVSKGWLATMIGTMNSGLPYTPTFARGEVSGSGTFVGLRENSARKPLTYNVDLRIAKSVDLGAYRAEVFFNIRNLFDTRNANWVYSDTGQPDYTLSGINQVDRAGDPDVEISNVSEFFTQPGNFTQPRFIQIGFRVSR